MNIRTLIIGLVTVFTLAGCSTQERMDYTDFTNSTPRSILVVVSQADTEDETAIPSVISSASLPLSEAGYYVIPVTSANDTLVRNGGRDPVSIRNIPHKKLKELFGADAVMYLTINDYKAYYILLDSYFMVSVTAELVDLSTGKTIWKETSEESNESGLLLSTDIVSTLVSALIRHGLNELMDVGNYLSVSNSYNLFTPDNSYLTNPILNGPHSPNYRKDKVLSGK